MADLVEKITIVPFHHPYNLPKESLPFELGDGVAVRDLSPLLSQADLSLWNKFVPPEEQQAIKGWSVCLEHRYTAAPIVGETERDSVRLLHYVMAHLRLLVPTKTSADYYLQAAVEANKLGLFRFTSKVVIFLEDCETLCAEIEPKHLQELKSWMPWVVEFQDKWRKFFPLFLSIFFSENAYLESIPEVRHLFRVMALEALVSSETVFGRRALVPRLGKLIGAATDLYQQYRTELQPTLPTLLFKDVIENVCRLRNKIGHGDTPPAAWLTPNRRQGDEHSLNYADEVREAATSMLSLAWREILNKRLQQTFADKVLMESFLK